MSEHQALVLNVTFVYDATTVLCPPIRTTDNGLCAPTRAFSFQQRSTSGRLREPDAWIGLGVELAPEPKFHPPPHFQQRKRFATTMAQRPPQKWCATLDLAAVSPVSNKVTSYTRSQSCTRDNPQRDNLISRACRSRDPNFT